MGDVRAVLSRKDFLRWLIGAAGSPDKEKKLKRKWTEIIVHHTWRPNHDDWEKRPSEVYWFSSIRNFHIKKRGWKDIGYHVLIFPSGLIMIGRDLFQTGAHTNGRNSHAVGVCLLGDFDGIDLNELKERYVCQYISLWFVLTLLLAMLDLPVSQVNFHRDGNHVCRTWKEVITRLKRKYARDARVAVFPAGCQHLLTGDPVR